MITEVMTKKIFLEFLDKLIDGKNEAVIFTTRLGNIKVLREKKKVYGKEYSSVFPSHLFEQEDSVGDLTGCKLTGVIICNKKFLNKNLQEEFKKIK